MIVLERCSSLIKSLVKEVGSTFSPFESGTELVAVVERGSKTYQLQLTLTRDEAAFIDPDAPTGCADDLTLTVGELIEQLEARK